MITRFQQQLLGTIVLVLLSVILLPSLLDGKKHYYQRTSTAISLRGNNKIRQPTWLEQQQMINQILPDSPPQGAGQLIAQQQEEMAPTPVVTQPPASTPPLADKKEIKTPSASVKTQSSIKAPDLPASKSSTSKGQYIVQLVALKNQQQAERLIAKLRLSGYNVYSLTSGQLTRVFVGPYDSKTQAEKVLPSLYQLTRLKGLVRIK